MSYIDKKQQIDELKAKIESFGELNAELKKKINYKFRLDWNYYSNSMEGNTLTMDETRSVMVGNITVEGKPLKDIMEIKGHDEIISDILKIGKGEMRLSEARIKEIHKGIMHEEDVQKREQIGKWKKEPNYLYNYKRERFDFAAPADVPHLMHDLLNKTNAAIDAIRNNKKDAPHPLDVAIQFHLDYIIIHPFYDGNGRTARILTNLLLISFGYPPFWVKNKETSTYNQYLGDIQGYGGDPNLFFEYCGGLVLRSEELVLAAIEGKDIEEMDDIDKEIALLKAELGTENVLNKIAEVDTVIDALVDNVIPVLKLLEDKMKSLKDFFMDYNRVINYEIYNVAGKRGLGSKKSDFDEMFTNWVSKHIIPQGSIISKVEYDYTLIAFKKSVNAPYLSVHLEVQFNPFNFSIRNKNSNEFLKPIPYGKKLSTEEIQKIVTPIVRNILDNIRRIKDAEKD